MQPSSGRLHSASLILLVIGALYGLVLVAVTAFAYSYDGFSRGMSGAAALILLATAAGLWLYRPRLARRTEAPLVGRALMVGLGLGILWIIEISINNFLAPPLPARDVIDDAFWAVIAIGILALAVVDTCRTKRFRAGIEAGVWSGLASGATACAMALTLIVFAMPLLLRDPLNVAEWAGRGPDVAAPTMAAYFAFETMAGALGHLVLLGVIMGGLLGIVGGLLGKTIRAIRP